MAEDNNLKPVRSKVLMKSVPFDPTKYEFSDKFVPSQNVKDNPLSAHTVPELMEALENPSVGLDAQVIAVNRKGKAERKTMKNKESFLSAHKRMSMKESTDWWAYDFDGPRANIIGNDFIPLLGGPFNKQLYLADYLRMNALCYFAYNHDPIMRRAVHIFRDFILGRGFSVQSDDKNAMVKWDSFSKANQLDVMMDYAARGLSRDGELMVWKLPPGESKITWNIYPDQAPPRAIIPRVRLIDPSCIWEIVTFPEDITRVLFYQWVSPTQYQMYTGQSGKEWLPSMKFIFRQIPAQEVNHYKINCDYNEKRGRSDLFSALGYSKRMRDAVDYSIVAMMKAGAYCLDTTIEGSQADLDSYVQAQEALGEIPPAGSEFVHTKAVTREYKGNSALQGGSSNPAFEWTLSMVSMATGVPVNYFGTHLGGATTRASALVATEPVAKMFEQRQGTLKQILEDLWEYVVGPGIEHEITFPEIVTADKSQKFKDLSLAQANKWISRRTAAEMVAKELGLKDYTFEQEEERISLESPTEDDTIIDPLTGKAKIGKEDENPESSLTSDERNDTKNALKKP